MRVDNQLRGRRAPRADGRGHARRLGRGLPATVHVPAGEQREADVTVHVPPHSDLKAAEWPLRVVAFARGRRVGSAPARVRRGPARRSALELRPAQLRARRRAHAEVQVRNAGDAAAGSSSDDRPRRRRPARLSLSPPRVHVGPGEEVVAPARGERARAAGCAAASPCPLRVAGQGATAEATFQQRAALPAWALVLPVVVAAFAAYFSARPSEVSVPQVTGLTVPEARQKLREAGLTPRQAPLPAETAPGAAGVVRQDPPAGTEIADGDDVTISYYRGEGIGTVTPSVANASVGRPRTPVRSRSRTPAGTRCSCSSPARPSRPSAGPSASSAATRRGTRARGELAYVRRAAPDADAEVVAVDPHAPGTPERCSPRARAPSSAPRSRPTAAGSRSSPRWLWTRRSAVRRRPADDRAPLPLRRRLPLLPPRVGRRRRSTPCGARPGRRGWDELVRVRRRPRPHRTSPGPGRPARARGRR